ncbi:MAG: hypothetical protein LBS01_01030 [Prevotellaceae bacterium]|jgi:hypothetical protein|nr:hypothetical protein [Prevotellaceae bacterium]
MTYKEWITATAGRFTLGQSDIDLILANQNELIPNPTAEVDVITAKTALCREFANIIPLANIGEGGYSVTWNWDAIKFWYRQTCSEIGLTPIDFGDKPKIRNKSDVW